MMAARTIHRLTPIKVTKADAGKYCDGGGLWLVKDNRHSGRWSYRFQFEGKSHELGLGSIHTFNLTEVREEARQLRQLQKKGINPLVQRRANAVQKKLDVAKSVSFVDCASAYIKAHSPDWSSVHAQQWEVTLRDYAYPFVDTLPVASVDTTLVMKILEQEVDGTSFWLSRSVTAGRLRARIENVLDWAKTRGYRQGENPARWRGHLENLLAKRSKAKNHLAALPYAELPAFMGELRERDSIEAKALEFTILTAARVGESLGSIWAEINLAEQVWTVPANRMKGGLEHKVPLSPRAIEILEAMKGNDPVYIFPGRRRRYLSDRMLRELLADIRDGYTVHGFRSSFDDWATECTEHPSIVVDLSLAHKVGDAVVQAYRRTDLRERRRNLLAEWAAFCAGENKPEIEERPAEGNVLKFQAA